MNASVQQLDPVSASVCQYLQENSSIAISSLQALEDDLGEHGLDSLQLIQLVIWIEDRIGKPVEIGSLFDNAAFSVSSIAQYIRSQIPN
jgi:acyl carrier protein